MKSLNAPCAQFPSEPTPWTAYRHAFISVPGQLSVTDLWPSGHQSWTSVTPCLFASVGQPWQTAYSVGWGGTGIEGGDESRSLPFHPGFLDLRKLSLEHSLALDQAFYWATHAGSLDSSLYPPAAELLTTNTWGALTMSLIHGAFPFLRRHRCAATLCCC